MKALFCIAGLVAAGIPVATDMRAAPPARAARRTPPPAAPTDVYERAMLLFGGRVADAARFDNTVEGFGRYLAACGVRSIAAADLTTPHHADVAARLGFRSFLPPRGWWTRGAALALLSERLSDAAGEKVAIRNWWRPESYNRDPKVGGAKNGDHPTANAVDLDYSSPAARARAERLLRALERDAPWLNLSLGLGAQTTHVGLGSPRGRREWHYAGWTALRPSPTEARNSSPQLQPHRYDPPRVDGAFAPLLK